MINALDAPAEAAWANSKPPTTPRQPSPPASASARSPRQYRLEAEVKQITHAIRMAACNAETTLARALDGRYARAGDEAYALIREALTGSGDIIPGHGQLLIRLDPLTAPRRTQAGASSATSSTKPRPEDLGTDLVLRYEVKPHPGTARNTSLCQESGVSLA